MAEKKTVTIRVDDAQWQKFKEFSARHKTTRNELLNGYIEECLSGEREPIKRSPSPVAQTDSQVMEAIAALQAKVTELEGKLPA